LTSYKVAADLITTSTPTFRCSRCKHTFILDLEPGQKPDKERLSSRSTKAQESENKDRELSFSFSSDEERQTGLEEDERKDDLDIPEAQAPSSTNMPDQQPLESERAGSEDTTPLRQEELGEHPAQEVHAPQLSITEHGEETSPKPEPERHSQRTLAELEAIPETKSDRDDSALLEEETGILDSNSGSALSVIPYLSLIGILLFTFVLVSLLSRARPTGLESFVGAIPWYGSLVLRNSHLRRGVALRSLDSGYRKILGGREVFVISGEVVNRNPVSVREIRIEGQIYGEDGRSKIERQSISVGNAISSKIIRAMTAQEIALLQRQNPLKRFGIPPEESATFTIVFLKPTKNIKAFSCKVLSAQGEA
jgi:hypothetical protein